MTPVRVRDVFVLTLNDLETGTGNVLGVFGTENAACRWAESTSRHELAWVTNPIGNKEAVHGIDFYKVEHFEMTDYTLEEMERGDTPFNVRQEKAV